MFTALKEPILISLSFSLLFFFFSFSDFQDISPPNGLMWSNAVVPYILAQEPDSVWY